MTASILINLPHHHPGNEKEIEESFTIHNSLSSKTIFDKYDGFILDQFGVMHNGVTALAGAVEAVTKLHQAGKKLIILSNSSSLEIDTVNKLPSLGFDPSIFTGIVTSGQEASRYVKAKYAGRKGLVFTWESTRNPAPQTFLDACGDICVTENPKECDFILLHGCQVLRGPIRPEGLANETDLGNFLNTGDTSTIIEPILKQCLARKIPMICANPDFIYVSPSGKIAFMPGTIAKYYQEMGGKVISFGKPHKEHFEACVRKLGLPKDKVVHVGDSLYHDIAGANSAGINSIFVTSGVHCKELGCEEGEVPTKVALEELFAEHNQKPSHIVPMLRL